MFPDHGGLVHQQAVVFHQATVDRRWGFDFLDDAPMLRQLRHEPTIEPVIEPQRVIRVGAGITHSFRIIRRQFIEIPASCHILERRQFVPEQFRNQALEAAIRKAPKCERLLESKLGRRNGVIARRLHDDSQGIEEHGLEGEVMRYLDNAGVCPHQFCQQRDHIVRLGIAALHMLQRDIDGAGLGHRQAHADDAGPMGVQGRARIIPILDQRRCFKVEGHHGGVLNIIFNPLGIGFTTVIHKPSY